MRVRVLQITEASVVPEEELFARLDALGALAPGARRGFVVELRDPALSSRDLLRLGARLRERTAALGAGLVVNDRLDLALALKADGVHLGRRSVAMDDARVLLGTQAWISVACHGIDDVLRAAREGAAAVLLSPIFASPGKSTPLGVGALAQARAALDAHGLSTQLVALGGVGIDNAGACFAAGADAVASIRADLTPVLAGA